MSKIFILRHGQTEWNVQDKYQGWHNSSLTKVGVNQSLLAGKYLSQFKIENTFYSPLGRVIQTMNEVKKYSKLGICTELNSLKELNYGDLEGNSRENMKQKYQDFYALINLDINAKYKTKYPNGESYEDAFNRVEKDIHKITKLSGNTLIIAHNGINKIIRAILTNKDPKTYLRELQNNDEIIIFNKASGKDELVKVV